MGVIISIVVILLIIYYMKRKNDDKKEKNNAALESKKIEKKEVHKEENVVAKNLESEKPKGPKTYDDSRKKDRSKNRKKKNEKLSKESVESTDSLENTYVDDKPLEAMENAFENLKEEQKKEDEKIIKVEKAKEERKLKTSDAKAKTDEAKVEKEAQEIKTEDLKNNIEEEKVIEESKENKEESKPKEEVKDKEEKLDVSNSADAKENKKESIALEEKTTENLDITDKPTNKHFEFITSALKDYDIKDMDTIVKYEDFVNHKTYKIYPECNLDDCNEDFSNIKLSNESILDFLNGTEKVPTKLTKKDKIVYQFISSDEKDVKNAIKRYGIKTKGLNQVNSLFEVQKETGKIITFTDKVYNDKEAFYFVNK